MSSRLFQALALLGAGMAIAGCSRGDAPTAAAAAVPVEQVPATIEQAFAAAPPETKETAREVTAAVTGGDTVRAFEELQHLTSQPSLTPAQRDAAARSMVALHERLRTSAEKGDKKAEEALEQYRATK